MGTLVVVAVLVEAMSVTSGVNGVAKSGVYAIE
jgi:hypothetical protein